MRVALLCGWAQPASAAQRLVRFLGADSDCRSVSTDQLYARGGSAGPQAFLEGLRHELASFEPEIVIGWSMGGMLAIEAVTAGLVSPHTLVLVSSAAKFVSAEDWPHGCDPRALAKLWRAVRRDTPRAVADFREQVVLPGSVASADLPELAHLHRPALLAGLEYLQEVDVRAHTRTITCRTIVVHGDADVIIPVDAALATARLIPGATAVVSPDEGHALLWTRPELIHSSISEWQSGKGVSREPAY